MTTGLKMILDNFFIDLSVLIKLNLMSPFVPIIGLIIATICIRMIFDGGVGFLTIHGFIK